MDFNMWAQSWGLPLLYDELPREKISRKKRTSAKALAKLITIKIRASNKVMALAVDDTGINDTERVDTTACPRVCDWISWMISTFTTRLDVCEEAAKWA